MVCQKIKEGNFMKVINKVILGVSILCFLWIFLFSLFLNSNVFYEENSFISFFISLGVILIWGGIYYLLQKKINKISKKLEWIILLCYFLLVTGIQVLVLKQLNVNPGWDFGVVFNNAQTYAETGSRDMAVYREYFQLFPNNISIFLLMVMAIKVGEVLSITASISVKLMNMVFIDISLILLYLVVRKKWGIKEALFSVLLTFFFLPLFLYTPIVYSDTLSLFVGVLFLYLFSFVTEEKWNKKNIILWVLIGVTVFLGKSLKITTIIIWIAYMLNYFLTHGIRNTIIATSIAVGTFLVLNLGFSHIIVPAGRFAFKVNDYGSYPYTHWLMMGVEDKDADNSGRNTYGGYNIEDYNKTQKFKTGKDAQKYNIEEFSRRIKKYGPVGYIMFLTRKNVNIWTDGYYFANVALGINPNPENTTLRNFIRQDSTKYIGIYYTQGVQYAFLLILIGGTFLLWREKKVKEIDILRLSIIGVLVFLSFWEGRSRYIVNYIPIFIIVIVSFYHYVVPLIKKSKRKA